VTDRSIFAILFLVMASVLQPALGDFPTFHADPQRTGNVSGPGPESPNLLWSEKVTAKGYVGGGAVVSGGRVYVSSWPDMSYTGEQGIGSLDAGDGSLLWLNPIGGKGGASTPALKDGRIYVGSFSGDLYSIDAETGETVWNRTLETDPQWWGIASSPLAIDEGVLATTFSGGALHLLSFEGEEVWNLSTGKIDPYTSPAYLGGKVYFAGGDPALYCVEVSSGLPLWKLSTDAPITSSPSVADGSVFFATKDHLLAADAATGDELWRVPTKGTKSSPAVYLGRVYVGTDDSSLNCYDESNGTLLWRAETNGPVATSPVVAGGLVYFGTKTGDGMVYALDAMSGSTVWSYDVGEYIMSSPAVSDGFLFIGADDGRVRAFGPETSAPADGDMLSAPFDSVEVNLSARTDLPKPEALFIVVENGAVIEEAGKGSPLNVTLILPEDLPSNLSGYDLIFLEMVGAEAAEKLVPLLEGPKADGVPIVAIHSEGYDEILANVDQEDHPAIEEYWNYGGLENMRRLFSYLGSELCGLAVPVEEPVPTPKAYIFHPDSPDVFLNTTSYLEWYRNGSDHPYNEGRPTVGVMTYYQDMAAPERTMLIRVLEEKGANVIDIGFSGTSAIKQFFIENGSSLVDAVILTKSFRINYGDPDQGISDLQELNVPVLNGIRMYYETTEEWGAGTGIYPTEVYMQVAMPEMDGVIEPIVIAGRNDTLYEPIEDQMVWLAERALSWAGLRKTPNSEKKVAIIYYNHGGGKDNLGATYINVPRSLQEILDGLNESGYMVEWTIPAERDLVDLMAHQGTNVGTWAPGELEKMVAAGNATLIPEEEYLAWFETIDPERQREVIERWGPPPGEIMVYENESGKYLVIPKLNFGNVILAPQPTRGWLQNNTVLYHNKDIPPHHQYIAFYFWLARDFDADFIVHLGKHGTQEWTPGKEVGISGDDCWPGILIQDLPVIYPYIVDNIAEGSQAKRRGDAVMITHLTPPIVASGLYGNFTNLAKTAFEYGQVENASVKEKYGEEIILQCRDLHLDEDLGVDLEMVSSDPAAFDEFVDELEHYLYDLKNEFMPYGLHTFNRPPEGGPLVEMVESMLGQDFKEAVALTIGYEDYPNPSRLDKEEVLENCSLALLSEVLLNKTSIGEACMRVLPMNVSENETVLLPSENLTLQLEKAIVYAEGLASCTEEMPRFVNASESMYTPPSPADDPIRDPEVLPTGRNFHSISPRNVPTPAAWEVGSALAEDLIEEYRSENNGTYPRKLAIVLWAWATTDHGVVESEILKLVGAEPVWDSYGGVTDVRLIPLSELGRPRIDVVVVPSGLHRDLFPEKLKLIDRAIRLAANDSATDYPNYVRVNAEIIRSNLLASGNYTEEDADYLSASRIFLEAAGTYGPNLDSPVSASDTWVEDSKLGNLFIDRMSYIYGDDVWGSKTASGKSYEAVQTDLYRRNLAEVEAAVHHTNSNLYGFADNDDVYQYMGGIAMAVRTVTGETPSLYVTDARDKSERGKVEPLKSFFSRELRSRYFNPKWIEGMEGQGYSGAREMDKFAEYLWGWDVTVPDIVTETMWNEVYDVYVNDKYDMGLKEFFDENNPYAYQVMTARMLEASRKDYWHPTEEMKQVLAEEFEESETEYGVTCCHHTCGNILLRDYMEGILTGTEPTEASSSSSPSKGGGPSRHPYPQDRPASSNANQTKTSGVGVTSTEKPAESESVEGEVSGFVMENVLEKSSMPSISGAPLVGIILVLFILLAIGAGFRRR
jgi:cobaltochelatase CobN